MALLIDIKHPEWMKDEELRTELLQFYPEADIRTGDSPEIRRKSICWQSAATPRAKPCAIRILS